MAGITDGQPVNATASNAAWLAKNGDDVTTGKLGLASSATADGNSVTSTQAQLNSFASIIGVAINGAYNASMSWVSDIVGSAGNTIKSRIEAIVALFSGSAGHSHTGVDGQGKKILGTNINSDVATSGKALVANGSGGTSWETVGGGVFSSVVAKTFSDSPITITSSDSGKLFAIDCSGGSVSVTLPAISGLSSGFTVGFKKTDSSANTITVNRASSDTIDSNTSKTISIQNAGFAAVPLIGGTSWESIGFGPSALTKYATTFSGTSVSPAANYMDQTHTYNGGSAQTFSTTGFGTLASLTNGLRITIVGSDDTNTLSIAASDITNGRLMNGNAELGKGQAITFEYNSTLARMVEISRNF